MLGRSIIMRNLLQAMSQTDDTNQWNASAPRRRKQHLRVFTGCATCRRRHVKCDECVPSCTNCIRRSLRCDYRRKISFKVTLPDDYQVTSVEPPRSQDEIDEEERDHLLSQLPGTSPHAQSDASIAETPNNRIPSGSTEVPLPQATERLGRCPAISLRPDLTDYPMLYYNYFLTTVSTMLIIYDTPSNSNPYRLFPMLAGSSGLLQNAMIALGAQHLAGLDGTQDRRHHHRAAIDAYAEAVGQLKEVVLSNKLSSKLESLSTSLLLCMFDQISTAGSQWKIHLAGACEVFGSIYTKPQLAIVDDGLEIDTCDGYFTNSMRRFLVSLLSYLDVAAACATGEGTLISGYYWETFGGGWEYNLGAPSFYMDDDDGYRVLSEIRHSWGRLMAIQADISKFAKIQGCLNGGQREMFQADLAYRIDHWHNGAPIIYARLSQLDKIPAGSSWRDIENLTATACVQSYAYACIVYLRRLTTQRLCDLSTDPDLKLPVEGILRLCLNFSDGLSRMAVLWPLFTAGTTLVDEQQQVLIRDCLVEMKCFGFKVC